MKEQFIGKTFWWTLVGVAMAHLVAFFVLHTSIEAVIVVVVSLSVFSLSVWRLELGLLIAFAELFVGSHGHLFSFEGFSIRMGIFVAVMLAWAVQHAVRRTPRPESWWNDPRTYPWMLLGLAVVVGGLIGYLRGNELANVFNDMNGYFYALYLLPMLSIKWVALKKRQLLQVLAAGTTWVIFETLALLYVFSHSSETLEEILYTFFRDARIAELTRVTGDIFRVFLQSQFTVVIGLFVLISILFWFWKRRQDRWLMLIGLVGSWATILISMSRSFWVGVVVGLMAAAAMFVSSGIDRRLPAEALAKAGKPVKLMTSLRLSFPRCLILIATAVTSLGLLWSIIAFPIPQNLGAGGFGSLLSDRATDLDEAAARSRWNLIDPMLLEIRERPFVGSGFGTMVTFDSDDPRIVAQGGQARTYAFEWGWLDIWLKMGFLGLLAFIWIFVFYAMSLWSAARDQESGWLAIGFLSALVALFALHIFTPFLNHPIGLGYLIFLLPFLKVSQSKVALSLIKEKVKTKKPAAQTTPAMTSRAK